ncbi:Skeletal muscle and kidney-enriched inositol phosphatase [Sarcoptes scabiei]|nr:Skeletal muscle and kidney-enriched inositol phosphatase [Sarcoptes scabiei]
MNVKEIREGKMEAEAKANCLMNLSLVNRAIIFGQILKSKRSITIQDDVQNESTEIQLVPNFQPLIADIPRSYRIGWLGMKTILPCNVNMSSIENDSIDLILWFRGQDTKALYSIDARRASTMQRAKHFSGDGIGSRAFIDLTSKPNSLVIESLKVLPKEIIIMDEFGQRLDDPINPFNEGKPQPMLFWYKNDQLIDDRWTVTAQGIVRNELLLPRLDRTDQGASLTCQSILNISDRSTIALLSKQSILNQNFLSISDQTNQSPLVADRLIIIDCVSEGARPPVLISWWMSSTRLLNATTDEIITNRIYPSPSIRKDHQTVSRLHLLPSANDNGQILSCRADHSVLSDSSLDDSWRLNVLFKPKLTISFGASIQHDNIHENSNVSLECHVSANPDVDQIQWIFNGQPLSSTFKLTYANYNPQSWLQFFNKTLLIYNIGRENSGRYRCKAFNSQGESESEEIVLKILHKPICKNNQRTLFGVAQSEPLQVPCTVESDPEDVTFRWMLNSSRDGFSKMIPINSFKVKQQATGSLIRTSILRFEPKSSNDYGQLLCWATNKLGEQIVPCRFDVIAAEQPQALTSCSTDNSVPEALIVQCVPGNDGGLSQIFHMEVFQADLNQMVANVSENSLKSNSPFVEFIVKNIPIPSTYILLLYASNAKGRSNYVTLSITLNPDNRGSEFLKFTSDFGIKPMMYLLMTVISLSILSIIIIWVISRVKSFKQSKDLNRNCDEINSNEIEHSINLRTLNNFKNDQTQSIEINKIKSNGSSNFLNENDEFDRSNADCFLPNNQINLNLLDNELYSYENFNKIPLNEFRIDSESRDLVTIDPNNQFNSIHNKPILSYSSSSLESSQPPPVYRAFYAEDQSSYLLNDTSIDVYKQNPMIVMDYDYRFQNDQKLQYNPQIISNCAEENNFIGSMTWSQAETLPLEGNQTEPSINDRLSSISSTRPSSVALSGQNDWQTSSRLQSASVVKILKNKNKNEFTK